MDSVVKVFKVTNSIAAFPKLSTSEQPKHVSSISYFITGFAKGSGMIRPDFATLLSFVFIDAKLSQKSSKVAFEFLYSYDFLTYNLLQT